MDSFKKILQSFYGITDPTLTRLEGEINDNILVHQGTNKWILKSYKDPAIDFEFLESENQVLITLNKNLTGAYPKPIPNHQGAYITVSNENGTGTYNKLFTFVEGTLWPESVQMPKMASSLGTFLAQMDLVLSGLTLKPIQSRYSPWDLKNFLQNEVLVKDIQSTEIKKLVSYFFMMYREKVWKILPELRMGLIHSDANDWNILVKDQEVTGLIDFGDMVHSHIINETAIALSYVLYEKEDPLFWAEQFIQAYHKIYPYKEIELDILYYLIPARLCTTLCRAASSLKNKSENEYLQVSVDSAAKLLQFWISQNPVEVTSRFRKAASIKPKMDRVLNENLKSRSLHFSQALSLSYSKPIKMIGAAFQYMYGHDGSTYLDAQNNIPHVGHCHPKVAEAGAKQMKFLNTNTRYLYDELDSYTAKLLKKFPEPLSKIFFVNSGSAATDLAFRLAQTHTQRGNIAALEHGYHGNTIAAIEASHYKFNRKGGAGLAEHIILLPLPDTYKGLYVRNDGTAGKQYAGLAIETIKKSGLPVGAFIAEPIVGCGGQVPLAKGYLREVYEFIRDQGGVTISDEVQVGFGRLGEWFWGFESQEVVPDIVILGKPMGNGHPIAAVVTTQEIARSFDNGMEFFSSFGGNPVSCAIGEAVLDVLEDEKLQAHAKQEGSYLLGRFRELQATYSSIGDVRGSGLFIGIEMIKDPKTRIPFTELAGLIKNQLRDRHILIGTDGPFDNVLKIKPPMCFNKENSDRLVDETSGILKSWGKD